MDHVEYVQLAASWRLEEESELLWRECVHRIPRLESVVAEFDSRIPVARRIEPFDSGEFTRPYRHLRAIYQRLGEGGGVIAYKGTELGADDRDATLEILRGQRTQYPSRGLSFLPLTEHFPIVEQKIPLAVTFTEALDDAKASLEFQVAHLRSFGNLARTPVPLRVLRWPERDTAQFILRLASLLSSRALKIVESVALEGLACFVYYYPIVPIRVAHLTHVSRGDGYRARSEKLRNEVELEASVERWIQLAARMLALGYFPSALESHGIGHSIEAQNAVIDGGFVDLGSMKRMADVPGEREFYETLMTACIDLTKTVRDLLLGDMPDVNAEYRNPSLVMMGVSHHVTNRLATATKVLAQTIEIDRRLGQWLDLANEHRGLDRFLDGLYPSLPAATRHQLPNEN